MEEGDEGKLRGAKRMRRDSTDDLGVGPEGQLVERLKGKEAEVDGGGVRVDEGEEEDTVELENERDEEEDEEGDEDGDEEEQVSGDDEDNEDDEGEEGDTVDDMDRRLNALQAGLDSESSARSQADGGSADEDDTD